MAVPFLVSLSLLDIMLAARRLAINPYGGQYPDDDSTKQVVLQADGLKAANPDDRHVLIHWTNGTDASGNRYTEVVHLTGGEGNYGFYTPQVKRHSDESLKLDTFYVLGHYTRAQRNQTITLAKAVQFNKTSRINNCQTWMRDLLEAMVKGGLLSEAEFNKIDSGVPLKRRILETTA
ncbi:hypothetical protein E1B28_012431 [Marasmius oreades]|uniref:Uncharacterized protein n=1 Tax=Marasmius oreades TaxID=181124 RepID=A0A9P7RRJ2_9AGAR|nr:uncharacterized protein E1B28_012431 [Marasmius oreades]KAG7088439.1 hypothetical protein E1B28_012431 [Marasmius oreades]